MATNDQPTVENTTPITRHPRSYLKRWIGGDGMLSEYRLIVEHARVPEWRRSTPTGTGYHEYLYTTGRDSALSDEIEHWLGWGFEDPAEPVISKAIAGGQLTPDEWAVLIRFVACQDVRTPARLRAFLKRQEVEMPKVLNDVMEHLGDKLKQAHDEGRAIEMRAVSADADFGRIPAKLTVLPGDDADTARLHYQMVIGREAWLWSLKHLLSQTAKVLHRHSWTILRSPVGTSWLTSDNLVIRLAFNSMDEYHFDGRWGRDGCEILIPLGPRHMLYTMVGDPRPAPQGSRCEQWLAEAVQRFTVENAHRLVFAVAPDPVVEKIRPGVVDPDGVRHEAREWREWHERQLVAERNLRKRPSTL